MVTLILADGTKLTGFTQNGNNFVSKEKVDESKFTGNLSTLTIDDEETQKVLNNAELIQQVEYSDGFYLCFREKTAEELLTESITDIQLAMADIYEQMLGGN